MLPVEGCHRVYFAHLDPLRDVPLAGLHSLAGLRNRPRVVRGRRGMLTLNDNCCCGLIFFKSAVRVRRTDKFLTDTLSWDNFSPTLGGRRVYPIHDVVEGVVPSHRIVWRMVINARQLAATRGLRQVECLSKLVIERFLLLACSIFRLAIYSKVATVRALVSGQGVLGALREKLLGISCEKALRVHSHLSLLLVMVMMVVLTLGLLLINCSHVRCQISFFHLTWLHWRPL